jgi:hypothetical protein
MSHPIQVLGDAITSALDDAVQTEAGDALPEVATLRDLDIRMKKLRRAWGRPQAVGLFGPSQAGKSFLVGALLSHETGSLAVLGRGKKLDFLKEVNPAKGVESTGVVTRFSAHAPPMKKGDFECRLLSLEVVLESMATGFLVECTSPSLGADAIDKVLRDAKLQAGPAASPIYVKAWEACFHDLTKKYQDRHPYLNELRRHDAFMKGAWKNDVKSVAGWMLIFSLLWGAPGYAPDLDDLMQRLVAGLDSVGHAEIVEASADDVRAASDRASILDASCLNTIGVARDVVRVFDAATGREVAIDPGVLSALIAEIRLPLIAKEGSLISRADLLDFPGGRALKGINGFGQKELSMGKLDHAIEVYKRGKLTFLFEQYALDREITVLLLCSPGPTKPEAIQLQSQVENWLKIRYGDVSPSAREEVESPSLFLALTKFDMSLGTLRSDNAKDRWDSRVQDACIDFWSRSATSWTNNWGGRGRPFSNLFWIRNPYADQMQTLKPGEPDFDTVKQGYFASGVVARYIAKKDEKWDAVEGYDSSGLPSSGVALLASSLRDKVAVDVKAQELSREARAIRTELLAVLKSLTPSRDEAEARARLLEDAKTVVGAVDTEMVRRASGQVFGELLGLVVMPEAEVETEVESVLNNVAEMSIKASDKVKRLLSHILRWWQKRALERFRASDSRLPAAQIEVFISRVCTSKMLLPVLGNAIFPYFSRVEVSPKIIASILQVKICDGLLSLFVPRGRNTPTAPVRLSFAERVEETAEKVDWSDVDFSSEEGDGAAPKPQEIVFAGNRYYRHWSRNLSEFYLKSADQNLKAAPDDPRIVRLLSTLAMVEQNDVRAP